MRDRKPVIGITGANGFVGSSLFKYLKKRNYPVLGIVRHNSLLKLLDNDSNNISRVDYHNLNELINIFSGLDVIVHCAARSMDWGKWSDFYSTNIQIVKNIVNASVRAGVKRIIHISTANVEGNGNRILDESFNNVLPFKYSKSKWKGENLLKALCEMHEIEYIILRPSAIYGMGDFKWSYEMIDRIKKSWWPLIGKGKARFTPLFIENLLKAIELAINTKRVNLIYNLTDNSIITWKDFADTIASYLNIDPKYKNFPFLLAITISIFAKTIHDIIFPTKEPFLTPYRIIRSSKDFLYSCNKAIEKLGYQPESDITINIRKTVEWYNNLLEKN